MNTGSIPSFGRFCMPKTNQGFPCGSAGKESTCNTGDPSSNPGLGRFLGEGIDYPLQDSGLENSMGCIVHEVAKSRTQVSDFHFQSNQACEPQLPRPDAFSQCPATRDTTAREASAPQLERSPPAPAMQQEKALAHQQRPSTAKEK